MALRGDPAVTCAQVGPTTSGIDLTFIGALGEAGALRWLDAISVHPYRSGGPESVLFDFHSLRSILRSHAGSPETIFSGEWGWGACRYPNGSAAVCKHGGGVGEVVTEHEQASRLARQWLVNDAANVSLSIWCECRNCVLWFGHHLDSAWCLTVDRCCCP